MMTSMTRSSWKSLQQQQAIVKEDEEADDMQQQQGGMDDMGSESPDMEDAMMEDDEMEHQRALIIDAADSDEAAAAAHGGTNQYLSCQNCEKVFWSDSSLKHHQSLYHSEKSFVCEICGKAFRFRSNLAEHRSVHTSLKPYVCKYCGKSSRLKGNLTKHILKHHKKEQNAYIGKDDIIIKKGKKSVKDPAAVDFLEKSMLVLTPDGQILEPEDRERAGMTSASAIKQMFGTTANNGVTTRTAGAQHFRNESISMVHSTAAMKTMNTVDQTDVRANSSSSVTMNGSGGCDDSMLDDMLPVEATLVEPDDCGFNTVAETPPKQMITMMADGNSHIQPTLCNSTTSASGTQCHLCGKHFRKGNSLQVHLTLKHGHAPPGSCTTILNGSTSPNRSNNDAGFLAGFTMPMNGSSSSRQNSSVTTGQPQSTNTNVSTTPAIVTVNSRSHTMNPMIGGGPPPLKIGNRLSTIPVSLPSHFNNGVVQQSATQPQQAPVIATQQSSSRGQSNSNQPPQPSASISPKGSPSAALQDQNQALGNELRELKRLVRDLRGAGASVNNGGVAAMVSSTPDVTTLVAPVGGGTQQPRNGGNTTAIVQAPSPMLTTVVPTTATASADSSLESRVSRLEKQVDSALTTIYTLVQLQSTMNTNVNRFREDVIDQLKGIRSMLTSGTPM